MCDDLLQVNLKARMYTLKPRILDYLKKAIRVEVAQIDRTILESVKANFQEDFQ